MCALKYLFYALLLIGFKGNNAFSRKCFDCVSILLCEPGQDFAKKILEETSHLSYEKSLTLRQPFYDAICGSDDDDPRLPKVCCSDFSKLATNDTSEDEIESHPNLRLLPQNNECGEIDGLRVVGGSVARLYEFPWAVLIAYNTRDGMQFLCAGTIINARYILTSATCVVKHEIVGVRIGELDYSTDEDCQGNYDNIICESETQDKEVEETIPHPDYNERVPIVADIALLRLKEPITITNNAAPICLPVYSELRNQHLAGNMATVVGWGVTENGRESTSLMKVTVPILTDDDCWSRYYTRYAGDKKPDSFCAGERYKDSCTGDNGGPLTIQSDYNNSIRNVQFGIVSFGPVECGSTAPGIYTDVSKYMRWILDNIRE